MGEFSLKYSVSLLLLSCFSLDAYSAYLRFLGNGYDRKLKRMVRIFVFFAIALFTLFSAIIWHSYALIPFSAYVLFRERAYYYRSSYNYLAYGGIQVFAYVLSIVFLLIIWRFYSVNASTIILCFGIAYLVAFVAFSLLIHKEGESSNVDGWSANDFFKYIIPGAFGTILAWVLGAADQAFVNYYFTPDVQAGLAIALRSIGIIRMFSGAFLEYWPRFYFDRLKNQDYKIILHQREIFILCFLFFTVLCLIFAKTIYLLLGASSYTRVTWIFCALAVGECFRIWASINATYLSYILRGAINTYILIFLGGIKLLLITLFIEKGGIVFAVSTTVGIYFLYWLLSILMLKAERKAMSSAA